MPSPPDARPAPESMLPTRKRLKQRVGRRGVTVGTGGPISLGAALPKICAGRSRAVKGSSHSKWPGEWSTLTCF